MSKNNNRNFVAKYARVFCSHGGAHIKSKKATRQAHKKEIEKEIIMLKIS
ncbi:hypothetical protein AB4F11_03685 [Francisella philomiragia]